MTPITSPQFVHFTVCFGWKLQVLNRKNSALADPAEPWPSFGLEAPWLFCALPHAGGLPLTWRGASGVSPYLAPSSVFYARLLAA